jgi:hypothetical protein
LPKHSNIVSISAVLLLPLKPYIAHKGKGVNLLKETSHRKRTKVDLEEVKNEEEELKEDKQGYLRQSKRLKEEKQDLLNTIEALQHY